MSKKLRVLALGVVIAATLILAGLTLLVWPGPPPAPPPHPNGYDDLLRAAGMFSGRLDDVARLDEASLRLLVETNAEALRVTRLGLARSMEVPTTAAIANFNANTREAVDLKALSKLLVAEGHLREQENRVGDAARSYLDAIRLGDGMSHGGLIFNRLVGISCEGAGGVRLAKLVPKLTADEIRPLLGALEQI